MGRGRWGVVERGGGDANAVLVGRNGALGGGIICVYVYGCDIIYINILLFTPFLLFYL